MTERIGIRQLRKKPVTVQAVQWCGYATDMEALRRLGLVQHDGAIQRLDGAIEIRTLEGSMFAGIGDWIIRGVKGEFYPCKPDIEALTYDDVTDEAKR